MYRVTWIPAILFVLSVPVFLVTASVSWAFNDPGVYHRGFQKYGISRTTGITDADLRQVAADLRGYFNSRQELLAVSTRIYGTEQAIFNPREVLHMADVKRLVQWVYVLCLVCWCVPAGIHGVGFDFPAAAIRAGGWPSGCCGVGF